MPYLHATNQNDDIDDDKYHMINFFKPETMANGRMNLRTLRFDVKYIGLGVAAHIDQRIGELYSYLRYF